MTTWDDWLSDWTDLQKYVKVGKSGPVATRRLKCFINPFVINLLRPDAEVRALSKAAVRPSVSLCLFVCPVTFCCCGYYRTLIGNSALEDEATGQVSVAWWLPELTKIPWGKNICVVSISETTQYGVIINTKSSAEWQIIIRHGRRLNEQKWLSAWSISFRSIEAIPLVYFVQVTAKSIITHADSFNLIFSRPINEQDHNGLDAYMNPWRQNTALGIKAVPRKWKLRTIWKILEVGGLT